MTDRTIADIAVEEGFSTLVAALGFIDANIEGSDLLGAVTSPGSLTVFAPTNAAFAQLAVDLGYTGDPEDEAGVIAFLTTIDNAAATLNTVVTYHILGEAKTLDELNSGGSVTTLQGGTIDVDGPRLKDLEPDLIDPSVVLADVPATNGVVHAIDKVLLPLDLAGNDASTFTEIVLESGTGFDDNPDDFDLLREAVVAAGLADTLNNADLDLTVFAPTDAAFLNLATNLGFDGEGEGEALTYILDSLSLLSKGADPIPLLTTVLQYHVAGESLQASQVLSGDAIPTLAGADIQPVGTTLQDLDPELPDPGLIATDIQAANGVLHVLDNVLIPADLLPSDGSNDVDFVIGDDTNEIIRTGRDNDWIDAKGGKDIIIAGSGDDVVLAGEGRDFVWGNRGDDHINGEDGNDVLRGGQGEDTIEGGRGSDFITGNNGADMLSGGNGRDKIFGGNGNDTIDGGHGNDFLSGGRGADTFVFGEDQGHDRIIDFNVHQDVIDLSSFNLDSTHDIGVSNSWFGATLHLDGTDIFLQGVYSWNLDADNFVL